MRRPEITTKDVARLAVEVKALSAAYNGGKAEGRKTKLPLEARVAFSFPRDVPKGAAAVRELVASGILRVPKDRPLRVLDLGAGLGAMTWGLVRALAAQGETGRVDALLVDEDPEVLEAAEAIARAAEKSLGPQALGLAVATRRESLAGASEWQGAVPWDVVLVGQVLSEIDPRSPEETRVESQVALLARVLGRLVAQDGALVVVEPALRERTRHLHAVRDRLLERADTTVFAPCLHRARCPMLAIETEWCHEDLPIDLPSWVAPLARASGLRWQGLTFSYLVLRRDGQLPVPRLRADGSVRFRVVSDLLRSKGKTELVICGEDQERRKIRQLDRDAGLETGIPFAELRRGDVVALTAVPAATGEAEEPIDPRGRIASRSHATIDVGAARQ